MSNKAIDYVRDHSKATNGRRLVLMVIADSAADDSWSCWLRVPEIAKRAKKSVRATQIALQQLQDAHEIYIEARYRDDGSRTSNRYTIVHNEATQERAALLEQGRLEADGTSPYMVENQRMLQIGEDWLTTSAIHSTVQIASPPHADSFTTPRDELHHPLLEAAPLDPSIIPNVSQEESNRDLKALYAPLALETADLWELWASAPETPICKDAPCPMSSVQEITSQPDNKNTPPNSADPPKRKRTEKQQARDELMRAVAWVWDLDLSLDPTMAGMWVNFCTNQVSKNKKGTEYDTCKIERVMTPFEIIGMRVLYDNDPLTSGKAFPIDPKTVQRRALKYLATRLTPDLEAKIGRYYDRVILGRQWIIEPIYPPDYIPPPDYVEPTPEEREQMKTQTLDFSIFGKSQRAEVR